MAREYVVENNDFSEFEHLTLDRVDRNGTAAAILLCSNFPT